MDLLEPGRYAGADPASPLFFATASLLQTADRGRITQMAEALARGFVAGKQIKAEDIIATDPMEARVKVFAEFGARTAESNLKVTY